MRKKIVAAIIAALVCGAAVPPVSASAERMPDIGALGSFLPGWFDNNDYSGFDDDASGMDNEDNQEDGYWYDVGEWEEGYDDEDGSWYDAGVWDDGNGSNGDDSGYDDDEYYGYDEYDYDEYEEELSAIDIAVNPEKKEIKKGKSFYISLVPADKSDWEGFSEEEWDSICEENIYSIEYSSTKKSVAYVNRFNGKVKARKKGSAVIKTTVSLVNGETVTFKTKVTVKK